MTKEQTLIDLIEIWQNTLHPWDRMERGKQKQGCGSDLSKIYEHPKKYYLDLKQLAKNLNLMA